MNILNSYRHIRPKKVKYPIPEIPDDSRKKSGTDWVLPKIIGSGRVSGTRQALPIVRRIHLALNICVLHGHSSNGSISSPQTISPSLL